MGPRAQRMIDDPAAYFAEARKEARAMVERDMEREKELARRQRREAMNREPLFTVAGIMAALTAVLGLLVAFGLSLSGDQEKAILGVAAVVAPLLVAAFARSKVTPSP